MNPRTGGGRLFLWLVTVVVSVAGVVAAHDAGWLHDNLGELVGVDVLIGSLVWFWLVPRMINRQDDDDLT